MIRCRGWGVISLAVFNVLTHLKHREIGNFVLQARVSGFYDLRPRFWDMEFRVMKGLILVKIHNMANISYSYFFSDGRKQNSETPMPVPLQVLFCVNTLYWYHCLYLNYRAPTSMNSFFVFFHPKMSWTKNRHLLHRLIWGKLHYLSGNIYFYIPKTRFLAWNMPMSVVMIQGYLASLKGASFFVYPWSTCCSGNNGQPVSAKWATLHSAGNQFSF